MSFDLDVWKEKVGEQLWDWLPRMERAGVNSVYAFLSAASLWPLVVAAEAGQLLPVMMALFRAVPPAAIVGDGRLRAIDGRRLVFLRTLAPDRKLF